MARRASSLAASLLLALMSLAVARAALNTTGVACDDACQFCSRDLESCEQCAPRFGPASDGVSCLPCPENCSQCEDDASECSVCSYGFGKDTDGACVQCSAEGCDDCQADYTFCSLCGSWLGPDGEGGCAACTDPNCFSCAANFQECDSCIASHVFTDGACQPCPGAACIECDDGATCTACNANYGLTPAGTCEPCVDYNCFNCSADYEHCTECFAMSGLDGEGACRECQESTCRECGADFRSCEGCWSGEGFNADGRCEDCTEANCLDCTADHTQCVQCYPFYELQGNGSCAACELQWVCTDVSTMDPYEGFPILSQERDCLPRDVLGVPYDLSPANGTVCGACGPDAPAPQPLDPPSLQRFWDAAAAVVAAYGAGDVDVAVASSPAAERACPGGLAAEQVEVVEVVGYCGQIYSKSGAFNHTLDVRFRALVPCADGGGAAELALRGMWSQASGGFGGQEVPLVERVWGVELLPTAVTGE